MLTCPVCDTPNEDGSLSCERCNCALSSDIGAETAETILSGKVVPEDEQTVLATAAQAIVAAHIRPRSPSSDLPPGTVLGDRYEIQAKLGQGGMGTVFRVLDRELDRVIALKTIRADLASNTSALRRLKQETLLTRQIAHRNVIRVFDLGVADDLRFITMEYVEGRDLRALRQDRKKLPIDEALDILLQIAQGLAAAHGEDVIHRDLKPQNVLISAGNRVRIVDFGLARTFENTGITHSGLILGTPAYMAPEQALGQPGDARSDFFSFGVIAFELLTGELPFPSGSLSESLVSRTRGRARSLESVAPEVPAWLARIVMKCLERYPADRYASAEGIVADLMAREVCPFPASNTKAGVLPPGTMIGSRYRIEAEAGEGGMGKVYRATDLDLQRTVALKVVRPDLSGSRESFNQLAHEIAIASQISHKNVLRIHDLGEASGLRFISMAWAEGEDLGHLLKRTGPLPEERILELAIEICEGLEAAHEQGICHRDLKPSNILLTSAGHACIADFGLAQTLYTESAPAIAAAAGSAESVSVSSMGTPRYMSPEQVDGAHIDHRSDIYSLGLILYEMATGRIPFNDESVFQTMTERLTATPVSPKLFNPELSDKLTHIILRCLQREREARYTSVRELLDDLRAQPAAPAPLLIEPAPPKRSKAWWAIGALAALVLVALAAWFVYHRRNAPIEPPRNGKYVAVLPFAPLGADPNLKYRAEGIADAISSRLSSLSSVHPVSYEALSKTSLAQTPEAIARQVGANLLVRGTVQQVGDRIKVDANIYNTEKGAVVWSNDYEGQVADLFTLEDRISSDAERALKVNPTIQDRERQTSAPTQNLAAYDLYLKGRDILKNHRDEASVRNALQLFEQARQQDDSFALAWTGVADASRLLYRMTHNDIDISRALYAAEEARRRNDLLPEVHFALGSVYTATGRNAEAISQIKRALELSPNSDDGYNRLGRAYMATGKTADSLAAYKKAVELNPYYWYNHNQLGSGYQNAGRYADALKEFQEQVKQNPTSEDGYLNIGSAYLGLNQPKKAIPELQKAISMHPSELAYSNLASAYVQLGRYNEAIPIYQKALELVPNHADIVHNLADAYARAGRHAEANQTYDRAIDLLYKELDVNPRDAHALDALAGCYAGKGEFERAHNLIRQARSIHPDDADLAYNEAGIDALGGHLSDGLAALKAAYELGFPFEESLTDPDIAKLRAAPEFAELRKQFGKR
ncbi:MAG TPA: protein kinase [Bryobacteraceae bacterium]|jgi:serine/threonine protein kinase/Flp pilus assembly protein TadD|nr:protein kinase [Bryobacteraceae bacterium]